jgi:hypothetical protein
MLHLRSFNRFILISLALLGLSVSSVNAATVQSFGTGTAVTSADFSAEFESSEGDYNPYLEDGLAFTNFNNALPVHITNFTGLPHLGWAGVNDSSVLSRGDMGTPLVISTQDGSELSGIEFNIGTGYPAGNDGGYWEAYRDGALQGAGGFNVLDFTQKISFADSLGFDTLFIAMTYSGDISGILPTAFDGNNAIAIDHLTAQALSAVPVPAAIWLFGTALIGLVGFGKRKARIAA